MKSIFLTAIFLISTAAFAQNRSGFVNTPAITRVPGSVLFPAGTSALPGVQRTTGSVLYPGGGGPQIGVPAAVTNLGFPTHFSGTGAGQGRAAGRGNNHGSGSFAYSYPVFVPSYYDTSYGQAAPYPQEQQQQQQQQPPNVVVIYPPAQPPVVINQFGSGDGQYTTRVQPQNIYPMQQAPAAAPEEQPQSSTYLIALKDHSIYSAVAYWVEGDTIHYFTTGNAHNQASVSLIDRELTERLNKESGNQIKLPLAR